MGKLSFVVHKHKATNLHYDLRLEVGGKMPSWAIPKGPTLDPKPKRLSVRVGDHDLEYKKFDGNLPEGSEGAGSVMVWDEGFYYPEVEVAKGVRTQIKDHKKGTKLMEESLKSGEVKFFLEGKKLKGSFALIKTKNFPPGSTKDNWLLIKHKDEFCKENFDANDFNFSAKSDKTLEEIAEG